MSRIRSSFALLAGCAVALGFGGTAALAADMGLPTKAAPMAAAAPPPPLDIHGFFEVLWGSDLINPHGQNLGTKGEWSVVAGLNWTLYKGSGWINSVTLGGLAFADFVNDPQQGVWGALFGPEQYGDLFDFGGAVTASATFWQYWTLRDQFTMVINAHVAGVGSSQALNQCNTTNATGGFTNPGCGVPPLPANELRLTFSDAFTKWWITFNPYVSWFYQFNNFNENAAGGFGNATQGCFSCRPNSSEFFIGMDPTVSMAQWWGGVPLTFKAPTYITVGPESFWTGGFGLAPGAVTSFGTIGNHGNIGIFTTGLTAIYSLKNWVPSNYGGWYVRGGFQWYDIINQNLRIDNGIAVNNSNSSVWVGFVGLGVTF
jgi:hypothetical protein